MQWDKYIILILGGYLVQLLARVLYLTDVSLILYITKCNFKTVLPYKE